MPTSMEIDVVMFIWQYLLCMEINAGGGLKSRLLEKAVRGTEVGEVSYLGLLP